MNIQAQKECASLEEVIGDEKMLVLQQAYRQLEAFQLSDEHVQAKEVLKARLAEGAVAVTP